MCEDIGEQQRVDFQTLKKRKEPHWVKSTLIQLFTAVHFRALLIV